MCHARPRAGRGLRGQARTRCPAHRAVRPARSAQRVSDVRLEVQAEEGEQAAERAERERERAERECERAEREREDAAHVARRAELEARLRALQARAPCRVPSPETSQPGARSELKVFKLTGMEASDVKAMASSVSQAIRGPLEYI